MELAQMIGGEVQRLEAVFGGPLPPDREHVERLLDQVTALNTVAQEIRTFVARHGAELVAHAISVGVDPGDLANRPYSARTVASIRAGMGLPPRRPGPRPVRQRP